MVGFLIAVKLAVDASGLIQKKEVETITFRNPVAVTDRLTSCQLGIGNFAPRIEHELVAIEGQPSGGFDKELVFRRSQYDELSTIDIDWIHRSVPSRSLADQ